MRSVSRGIVATCLFLTAGCGLVADDAQESAAVLTKKLSYQPVDITAPPPGFLDWFPLGLSDKADVYGQGIRCDDVTGVCNIDLVKRQTTGQFEVLRTDFAVNSVNGKGDAGGCIITDSVQLIGQAAVFDAHGKLEVYPRLADEFTSCVSKISESGLVIVTSFNLTYDQTTYIVDKGRTTFITPPGSIEDVNDRGQIAGIVFSDPEANRAYRFDSATQTTAILDPVSPDPQSWGQAINRHGEVLGYSFVFSGVERIGKWNRRNEFETSFVEGTPEFPTVSNRLIWNEDGLIVISFTTDGNTYLVPQPGVRLNLADLLGGATVSGRLIALEINKGGDFIAQSFEDFRIFLLRRN